MGILEIDTGNPDLFKPFEFKTLPKGKHLFEVANDLIVEPASKSDNNVVKVELVCQDEDDNKGTRVFDTFTIITDTSTDKGRKAQAINQGRLSQFAVACGVKTQAEIREGSGIPLEEFKGKCCEAITKVVPYTDPATQESKTKGQIVKYLFEPE